MAATLEKTWFSDMSRVNGGAATVTAKMAARLWYIKALLTGTLPSGNASLGLWTVEYSCDSVAAGTPADHVDRWTTAANVVFGTGAGSIASWIVLSRLLPNGMTIYLCLHACGRNTTGAATPGHIALVYSKAAFVGGTTTARPVNTADCFPALTTEYGTCPPTASTAAQKCHGALTTDGSSFWCAFSVDGAGYCETFVMFSQLADAKAGDAYPFWQFQGYLAVSVGASAATGIQSVGISPYNTQCRNYAGAGPYSTPLLIPAITGTLITAAQNGVDPCDNTWLDWPAWVGFCAATPSGGAASFKGRIPDFAIAPTAIVQGSMDVPSGTPNSVVIGNLWVPAHAAPSL